MSRWVLFALVGMPLQLVVYVFYPLVVAVFYITRKGSPVFQPARPISSKLNAQNIDNDILTIKDKYFLKDNDSHGALVHGWFWGMQPQYSVPGLNALVRHDGGMRRWANRDHDLPVSGDCLVAWCWSYMAAGASAPELVHTVATHFLKNVFSLTHTNGKVTTRGACGGVSTAFDGWGGLSQPCFGPQYYTGAAILALAARECGGRWKEIYWAHWVLMGGWLWWIAPVIHPKKDSLYYVQDVTLRALWVVSKARGITYSKAFAFRQILRLTRQMNPFFYAHAVNAGAVWGQEKECEDRLLSFQDGVFGFMPQRNPDDANYFDNSRAPRHKSVIAFALKLLWSVK